MTEAALGSCRGIFSEIPFHRSRPLAAFIEPGDMPFYWRYQDSRRLRFGLCKF